MHSNPTGHGYRLASVTPNLVLGLRKKTGNIFSIVWGALIHTNHAQPISH